MAAMSARLQFLAVAALCAGAPAARAEPPIATAGPGAPPPAESSPAPIADEQSPDAIGAWARDVIAGRPSAAAAQAGKAQACPASDGKPHGEVWAGVGTGGYREAGGVVTQPVGDCGQVTIGVSRTQGRWR